MMIGLQRLIRRNYPPLPTPTPDPRRPRDCYSQVLRHQGAATIHNSISPAATHRHQEMVSEKVKSEDSNKNELVDDVLIEILMYLPLKSLLRFRCVSKKWCAITKSPYFVRAHLSHHSRVEVIVIKAPDDKGDVLSFHSNDSSLSIVSPELEVSIGHCYMLGDCNGLIFATDLDRERMMLCNPTLREVKLIPPRPFGCPQGFSLLKHSQGFGFDPLADDFKIVNIMRLEGRNRDSNCDHKMLSKVEIYDLSLNSWREIDAQLPEYINSDSRFKYFNGACYWIAGRGYVSPRIISFNLSLELFRTIDFPEVCIKDREFPPAIQCLHQSLALICYDFFYHSEQYVDIWVIKEGTKNEAFTKLYTIGPVGVDGVLSTSKDDKLLLRYRHESILLCDVRTNAIKQLRDTKRFGSLLVCKESLFSIK